MEEKKKMIKYYGILAAGEIDGLVKIEDGIEAYVFNQKKKKFVRDNYYLAAAYDPGTDFWDLTEEEAMEILEELIAEEETEDEEEYNNEEEDDDRKEE